MSGRDGAPSSSEEVQEPERRLVSVLFADLTGFTAAAGERDPEEVHALLSPVMARLEGVVESFGGRVVKTMGDGMMAVFGVPAATPEDAERAVRAAVAMRDAVRESASDGSLVSDLQAGVHTGWVFVVPARGGFDVIGDTVNVAARLVGLAQAGSVLVGASTAQRTSSVIEYREREPAFVKGKPEPIPHCEVVDASSRGSAGSLPATAGPFVGRDDELGRLRAEWDRIVAQGRSGVVSVLGPPGIGKSRLLAEFVVTLPQATVLVGRAAPHAERIPWFALSDALREDAGGAELRRLLGPHAPAPLRRADRSEMNSEIGAAVRTALSEIASHRPALLLLEDVHWADAQLAALLTDLEAHPWDVPLLVVCLGRADTASFKPDAAVGPVIRLESFPRATTRDLIRRLLPEGALPAPVEEELAARAGGNPLFVEEIVHLFRETGVLRREAGRWHLVEGSRPDLPESVQLVVAARIDALPPQQRRLLRDAAVCGESFRRGDVRALGWEDPEEDLNDLVGRDLMVAAPSGGYAFRHAVIREVAYGALPRAERARRHLALAAAIRSVCGDDDAPVETLAHHYAQAALASAGTSAPADTAVVSAALEYLVRAGDRARSLRAFREAEAWYRQAMETHEPSVETSGTPHGRAAVRALLSHASTLIEMHRYEAATGESSKALEIARALGQRLWEAEAILQLGWLESEYGNLERARRLLERAGENFTATGDTLGRARVVWATARTMRLTDVDGMLSLFEQAAALFAEAGDRVSEHLLYEQLAYGCSARGGEEFARWFARCSGPDAPSDDPRGRAALSRTAGFHLFYSGAWIEALEPLTEARRLARESGDFFVECDAIYLLARIAVARGALDGAARLGETLVAAGVDAAAHRQAEQGHVALARVAARWGDEDAAHARLERADELLAGAGNEREQQEVILARADIALDAGRWEEAGVNAARYRERAERFGDRLEIPVPMLIAGRALLGEGRLKDAAATLRDAAAVAAEVGHVRVGVMASSLAAEALALLGRPADADELLAMAKTFADPARMLPDEAAAAAEAAAAVADASGRASADLRAEAVRGWRSLGVNVWEARAANLGAGRIGEPSDGPRPL